MRLIALFARATALYGTDRQVCASAPCYTTVQLAIDAAACGDTVSIAAGQVFTEQVHLKYKGCDSTSVITLQSSQQSQIPATGIRLDPVAQAAYMPTIQFGDTQVITTENDFRLLDADIATDTLNTSSAHGFSVGEPVLFWAYGRTYGTLPAPLTPQTQIYYVVAVPTSTSFRVSLTAGGTPVDLTTTGSDYERFVFSANAPAYYRLTGLNVRNTDLSMVYPLISLGFNREGVDSARAHHISIDHCYIHGFKRLPTKMDADQYPQEGVSVGVAMYGDNLTVRDSYIDDIVGNNEPKGIGILNASNLLIENNFIAASESSIFAGGGGNAIPKWINGPVTVRHNYLYKRPEWKYSRGSTMPGNPCLPGEGHRDTNTNTNYVCGIDGTWATDATTRPRTWSKNISEWKNVQDLTFTGNILDGYFQSAAGGQYYFLLFSQVDQDGVIRRASVQNNILRHGAAPISIAGYWDTSAIGALIPEGNNHITLKNNLGYDLGNPLYDSNGGNGYADGLLGGANLYTDFCDYCEISHNTLLSDMKSMWAFDYSTKSLLNFVFRNNIMNEGNYGIAGSGQIGQVCPSVSAYLDGTPVIDHNVVINNKAASLTWTPCTTNTAHPLLSAVGFVNAAANDYHLAGGSTYAGWASDGTDAGADIDAILAATAGVDTGTIPPTPSYSAIRRGGTFRGGGPLR